MEEIINYFNDLDNKAKENANELYKKYGNRRKYKRLRIKQFEIGNLFTYDNLEYKIVSVEKYLVCYELLTVTDRKAPSGRPLKRRGCFGLTSNMDLELRFIT